MIVFCFFLPAIELVFLCLNFYKNIYIDIYLYINLYIYICIYANLKGSYLFKS